MIDRINRKDCTGCGACMNACPRQAIHMKRDSKGFLYPEVEKTRCIECNICLNKCPVANPTTVLSNYLTPLVFASWSLDESIRINSTSGGIFSELAKGVLKEGGCVAGAQYNAQHLVEHTLIDNATDLMKLRQSKYIQSDVKDIYIHVKKALEKQKIVLFVGSPCEIAGIRAYLGKDYENLILCDFVCRGTNSPKAYTEYLKDLEKRYKSKVKKVWFKNKTKVYRRS